jgi:hypothetical protein
MDSSWRNNQEYSNCALRQTLLSYSSLIWKALDMQLLVVNLILQDIRCIIWSFDESLPLFMLIELVIG